MAKACFTSFLTRLTLNCKENWDLRPQDARQEARISYAHKEQYRRS